MVSYASTNALSMLGGDDYTTLQQEILDLSGNAGTTFVHKTGNLTESIDGDKTFTNDFIINAPSFITNSVGGINRLDIGASLTTITNPTITNVATTAFRVEGTAGTPIITTAANTSLILNPTSTYSQQINSTNKVNISGTITTMDNTTGVDLQIGGVSFCKSTSIAGETTLNGPSYAYLNVGGDTKIELQSANSLYKNTNGHIMSVATIEKFKINTTTTTITNPTITNVATTAFKVQNVSGTDNLSIIPTTTTITNPTITNVATTAFKVQNVSGTDKLSIAPTQTVITNASILLVSASVNKINIDSTDTRIKNTTIYLDDGLGNVRYEQTNGLTTLTNDTINEVASTAFKVQNTLGTDKLNIAPALTTITNTEINLVAGATGIELYSLGGNIDILADGVGTRNRMKSDGENLLAAITAGKNTLTAVSGLTSITSTSGQIELKTGSTTLDSILLENTNVAGAGIHLKTNGASANIKLTSAENILTGDLTAKGTTILLQDTTPTTHYSQTSTVTAITNTTINLRDATPTVRFQQTSGTTTITNPTITNVATTAFKVQNVSGTDKLSITPAQTVITSASILLVTAAINKVNIDSTNTYIKNTNLYLQDGAGNTRYDQTNGLTTLTNTNVDVVAHLNATDYFVGTAASGRELMSYQLKASRLLSNQPISAVGITYNMNFGNNTGFPTTNIGTPNIIAIPVRCSVFFDSGAFVGGGTATIVVKILTSGGTLIATSASMGFTTFSGALTSVAMTANSTPARNAILQMTITITNTTAISASNKNVYAIVYCQQQ